MKFQTKKGLQKLTETQKKIDHLLSKPKITKKELDDTLTNDERVILAKQLTEKLNSLKGYEKDRLLRQIDDIIPSDTKNQIWEANHINITSAISKYIENYGSMPGKTHISEETGLSRQTIHKHLKEFDTHPCYLEEIRKFKFMSDRVLSKVFKLAIAGDTKAARLYFEMIGKLSQNEKDSKTLNTQNNFIQINQIKVDQETIKQLDSEQIRQAELLFKAFIKKDKVHDN